MSWKHLEKFSNISNIVISSENLWLPDMAMQNRCLRHTLYHFVQAVVFSALLINSSFCARGCTLHQFYCARSPFWLSCIYYLQQWTDHRLKFNSTKHSVVSLVVSPDVIWLPDIGLQNRYLCHVAFENSRYFNRAKTNFSFLFKKKFRQRIIKHFSPRMPLSIIIRLPFVELAALDGLSCDRNAFFYWLLPCLNLAFVASKQYLYQVHMLYYVILTFNLSVFSLQFNLLIYLFYIVFWLSSCYCAFQVISAGFPSLYHFLDPYRACCLQCHWHISFFVGGQQIPHKHLRRWDSVLGARRKVLHKLWTRYQLLPFRWSSVSYLMWRSSVSCPMWRSSVSYLMWRSSVSYSMWRSSVSYLIFRSSVSYLV